MSEREEGWYWVKPDSDQWEVACWDGGAWLVADVDGSWPESEIEVIGPRIPFPNEAPPIGQRYRNEAGEVVAAVVPADPQEEMLDATRALMMLEFSNTFENARRHVGMYHGKDALASWPDWAMEGDEHIPKNARSSLMYRMMLAALPEPD